MAAAGTPDSATCNISGAPITGAFIGCISNFGVNDMVGNLDEWVADWIQGNTNPWAPSTMATTTGAAYGSDMMFGVNPAQGQGFGGGQNFPAALLRGGGVGHGTTAGVFALAADDGPSLSDRGVGFRCAR